MIYLTNDIGRFLSTIPTREWVSCPGGWWPTATTASAEERALLAAYLSSHHSTTRMISKQSFFRLMRFVMDPKNSPFDAQSAAQVSRKHAANFEKVWLKFIEVEK